MDEIDPATRTWTLQMPEGNAASIERVATSINQYGLYSLTGRHGVWEVCANRQPPAWIVESGVRRTAAGLIGSTQRLQDHIDSWPSWQPLLSDDDIGAALEEMDAHGRPEDAFELARVRKTANDVMISASPRRLVEVVMRVAARFLLWYPYGQMVFWLHKYEYVGAARSGHLLAAMTLTGLDSVERAMSSGQGAMWFGAEDIVTTHPEAIYVGLPSTHRLGGLAWATMPMDAIFEFGDDINITFGQALDHLSIAHLHSLPSLEYMSRTVQTSYQFIEIGRLHRDALRGCLSNATTR